MMNNRNLGRFKVEERMIRNEPEKVAAVFAILKCVPVRAEMLYAQQSIEYTAIAEPFAEIKEGNLIPEYSCRNPECGYMHAILSPARECFLKLRGRRP